MALANDYIPLWSLMMTCHPVCVTDEYYDIHYVWLMIYTRAPAHLPFQEKYLLIPRNSNTHIETIILLSEQSYASTAQNTSTGGTAPKKTKKTILLQKKKKKKETQLQLQ